MTDKAKDQVEKEAAPEQEDVELAEDEAEDVKGGAKRFHGTDALRGRG